MLILFSVSARQIPLNYFFSQKFDFERHNKINVSMFERLIRAPPGHAVPNGVLSIQRRMCRDVCDLTRDYYKDIVEITDHSVTQTCALPGKVQRAVCEKVARCLA